MKALRIGLAQRLRQLAAWQEERLAGSFPGSFFAAVHDLDVAFAGLWRALADAVSEQENPNKESE